MYKSSMGNSPKVQSNNITFKASLIKQDSLTKYLNTISPAKKNLIEDSLDLLKIKLRHRPEKDILEIGAIPANEAKEVITGSQLTTHRNFVPKQYYGHINWTETKQLEAITGTENLELKVNNKKLGFFVNDGFKAETIANWLEKTYEYLQKGLS